MEDKKNVERKQAVLKYMAEDDGVGVVDYDEIPAHFQNLGYR